MLRIHLFSVFTIKRPKGASAARACGVLMVKILNKCTLTITCNDPLQWM